MVEGDASASLGKIPQHVAFIMDGNGRWAQARGLPRNAGHRAGRENVRRVLDACQEFGVRHVTLYAFSTENWKRPTDEVRGLMNLFENATDSELEELHQKGVQIRHLGRMEGLSALLRNRIRHAIRQTRDNQNLVLSIALNYGGRAEIVDAVRRMIGEGLRPEDVTEASLGSYLYTAGLPDPDLVVRTAGELRLSNFLVWQAAYAEYYVTPTFWPDFDREELRKALLAFDQRHRRFGQLDQQVS